MMKRYEDWQVRLHEAFLDSANAAFEYGIHDCCAAACTLIEKMTGTNPIKECGISYQGKKQAYARISEFGDFEKMILWVVGQMKARELNPSFTSRGDAVLISIDPNEFGLTSALGIVSLSGGTAWTPDPRSGWMEIERKNWLRAWEIPQ